MDWDEIDARLGGYYGEEEMAGNTKPPHPIVSAIISGVVVGVVIFGLSQFFGDAKYLAGVGAKLEIMQQQLTLLSNRPYLSRDEFERELSRLERRVERVERELQSDEPRQRVRK